MTAGVHTGVTPESEREKRDRQTRERSRKRRGRTTGCGGKTRTVESRAKSGGSVEWREGGIRREAKHVGKREREKERERETDRTRRRRVKNGIENEPTEIRDGEGDSRCSCVRRV